MIDASGFPSALMGNEQTMSTTVMAYRNQEKAANQKKWVARKKAEDPEGWKKYTRDRQRAYRHAKKEKEVVLKKYGYIV